MKVIAFEPEHALKIKLQSSQYHVGGVEYLAALQHAGTALTAIHHGHIIACGGIARTNGYGTLWGYIAADSLRSFVSLDRVVRRLLASCELQRVEATVVADFINGCRWLELLGFTLETPTPMRKYGLNGEDHFLYAWVR